MGMGPIIWACLVLTAHQGPIQEFYVPDRGFEIPIKMNDKARTDVQELILLFSSDQGTTWRESARATLGTKSFRFNAPQDGRYWFIVQEVDRAGRRTPNDPARVKPNLAVIVDTQKPRVQLTAERLPSGDVAARWSIADTDAAPQSLRLEYHTDAHPAGQWTPLAPSLGVQGRHEFDPGQAGKTGAVRVRVRVKDQAENVGEAETTVAATGSANPSREMPTFGVVPTARAEAYGQPNVLTSRQNPRPNNDLPPPNPSTLDANPLTPARPAELNPSGPLPIGGLPVASNSERPSAIAGSAVPPPQGALPPLRIVNKQEVRLDFTVAKVGPSGLGNADVWVTVNEGAHWAQVPGELPIALAAGADLHGVEPVRGSVMVKLPAEGTIYGFVVLAKSKAGRGPQPPRDGDPPAVRVELDTTAPKAELLKPLPDANQPNTLVLAWRAVDRNLAENPITLEWSERKDGTWNPIGNGPLPNSGQYAWHLPDTMPSRVFLRMTVRDSSGNESRAQTDKPELIDLSIPQTTVIGVGPGSR